MLIFLTAPGTRQLISLQATKVKINLAGTRSKSHRGDLSQHKRHNYAINTKQVGRGERIISFCFNVVPCRPDNCRTSRNWSDHYANFPVFLALKICNYNNRVGALTTTSINFFGEENVAVYGTTPPTCPFWNASNHQVKEAPKQKII